MTVLGMMQRFNVRPSEIMAIDDPYTAYCLDEACLYIVNQLDKGEEICFRPQYTSFTELYAQYQ